MAETLALKEYEKYRKEENKKYISDFDREVKKLEKIDVAFQEVSARVNSVRSQLPRDIDSLLFYHFFTQIFHGPGAVFYCNAGEGADAFQGIVADFKDIMKGNEYEYTE